MLIIVYSLVDPSRGAHFDGLVVCAFLLLQGSIAVHSPYFSESKIMKSWDNNIGSTYDRQLSDHPLRKMADAVVRLSLSQSHSWIIINGHSGIFWFVQEAISLTDLLDAAESPRVWQSKWWITRLCWRYEIVGLEPRENATTMLWQYSYVILSLSQESRCLTTISFYLLTCNPDPEGQGTKGREKRSTCSTSSSLHHCCHHTHNSLNRMV